MLINRSTSLLYIPPGQLTLVENALGNPNLVQSSSSASCTVTIVDKENIPLNELEEWPVFRLVSKDIVLNHGNGSCYIYIAVPKPNLEGADAGYSTEGIIAEVVYPPVELDRTGKDASDNQVGKEGFLYYKLGSVSAVTDGLRTINVDLGVLPPVQNLPENISALDYMIKIDQLHPTDISKWLLSVLSRMKTTDLETDSLTFSDNPEDAVRKLITSFSTLEEGALSDEALLTAAFIKNNFLSRTNDDTAEGLINFEKGVRIKNLILKVENDVLSLTNIENGKRAHFAASGTVSSLGVGTTGGGGGSSEGGASALYQLLDVLSDGTKVEGAEDGSVLTYDENAGKWKATKIDIPEADLTEIEGQLVSIGQLIKALQGKDTEHSSAITALQQKDREIEAAIGSNTKGIESLQGQLNTLVSGNASTAIDSFNEVVAFLKDIEDTDTLEGILAGKQNKITETNKLDYSLLANTPSLADFMGGSAIGGSASSDNFSAVYWDGKQWQTRTIYKWALASNKPSYTTSEVTEGTRLYFTDDRAKDALKDTTDALSARIAKFEKMFQWGNGDGSYVKTPFSFASDKTVSSLGVGSESGGGGVDVDWNNFPSSIIPSNSTYDLGSNAKPWDRVFASYFGTDNKITYIAGKSITLNSELYFSNGIDHIDTDGNAYLNGIQAVSMEAESITLNGNNVATTGDIGVIQDALDNVVTKDGYQTISGKKEFTGGIDIRGQLNGWLSDGEYRSWLVDHEGNGVFTSLKVRNEVVALAKDIPSLEGYATEAFVTTQGYMNFTDVTGLIESYAQDNIQGKYFLVSGGTLYDTKSDTPLNIKGGGTAAYIGFQLSDGTTIGSIGVNDTKAPLFYSSEGTYRMLHKGNTSFSAVLTTGTKIGTITIGGTATDLYAPVGGGVPSLTDYAKLSSTNSFTAKQSFTAEIEVSKTDKVAPLTVQGTENTAFVKFTSGGSNLGYLGFSAVNTPAWMPNDATEYLPLATQAWVEGKGYATTSDLNNLGDNIGAVVETNFARKATTLEGYGITDALSKKGGTIDGALTVKGNVYIPNIYFNGTETERVLAPYTAYNYDLSYYDGSAWNRLIHSGNIGSQSVASAEMLVSPHSYEYGLTIDNDTTAESLLSESYAFSSMMGNTTWNNNWSTVFTFSGYKQYGGSQIAFDYNGYVARMAIRNYNQTFRNWNSWREVAFVDSNVASADYATSAKYIKHTADLNNPNTYPTVKSVKDALVSLMQVQDVGIGDNIVISSSVLGQWYDDNASTYYTSAYSVIKIGGAYSNSTYGQWLLSSYGDSRVGYVGRNKNVWGNIHWLATLDDIYTRQEIDDKISELSGGNAFTGGSVVSTIYPSTSNGASLGTSNNKWAELYVSNIHAGGTISAYGDITTASGKFIGDLNGTASSSIYASTTRALVDSQGGKSVVYVSGDSFYVGDNIYSTAITSVLGKEVRLRYGENASTGLILNSNGNVLIGATTDSGKKLQVAGNTEIQGSLGVTGNISAQGNITTSNGSFVGNLSGTASYATSAGSASNATKWNNFNYQNIVTDGQNKNQCFKLITIRIKSSYTNSCISFDISGRSKGVAHIEVHPYNSSTIGSSHIGSLRIVGDSLFADKIRGYVIGNETDSSGNIVAKVIEVWMTKRSEGYDSVVISNVHYGNNESVTVNATEYSSLPTSYESYVDATMGSIYGSITKLTTPRTIWGQSFDGSGDVSGYITTHDSLVIDAADYYNSGWARGIVFKENGYDVAGLFASGWHNHVDYINLVTSGGYDSTNGVRILSNGNVLIGTTTDSEYKLNVNGKTKIDGILTVNYSSGTRATGIEIQSIEGGESSIGFKLNNATRFVVGCWDDSFYIWNSAVKSVLNINNSGNMTIGSSDLATTNYKLYVNGNSYVNGALTVSGGIKMPYNDGDSTALYTEGMSTILGYIPRVGNSTTKIIGTKVLVDSNLEVTGSLSISGSAMATQSWVNSSSTPATLLGNLVNQNSGLTAGYINEFKADTINGGIPIHSGNIGSFISEHIADADVYSAAYLRPVMGTYSPSSWNPKTSYKKVWGESFSHKNISSDVGDILYYLRASEYGSGTTELCVVIDGDYYAGTGQYKVIHEGNIGDYAISKNGGAVTGTLSVGSTRLNVGSTTLHGDVSLEYGALTLTHGTIGSSYWSITNDGEATVRTLSQTSDITKKNVISDIRLSLGEIANAPLIKFTWADGLDSRLHVGTIAQYWEGALPEVVSITKNDTLALNYGELGVAMGISLANHLTETNDEVSKLKKRVEELETENKRLQERVDALVA